MSVVLPIENDSRYRTYTASALQTVFPVQFPFQDNSDIGVYYFDEDSSDYIEISNTLYTLTGAGNAGGGSLAFTTGRTAGDKILILGKAVLERLSSVVRDGRFSSLMIDDELDRNRLIQQEQQRDLSRAVKMQIGDGTGLLIASNLEDGDTLMKSGNQLVKGANALDIANAQENAAIATAAAQAVELGLDNRVRFDEPQTRTSAEQSQARENIDAASGAQGALASQLPDLSLAADPKALFRISDDGKSLVPYFNRLQKLSIFDDRFCTKAQWSDVISGSPALNVAAVVQSAINYATQEKMIVQIPQVFPKLGQQITFDSRVNIECDDHAMMWFTNAASAGFKVTGYLAGNAPGYGHVRLPQGIGPGDISGYTGSATTNSYSTSGFTGSYLTMEDCVWMKVEIMQGKGWGAGIEFTSNVFGCFNLDVKLGTLDLCKTPVLFTPKNGKSVGQSRIVADNLFGLFPLYFDVSGGGSIFELDINALGLVVAESGGLCICTKGVTMSSPYTMTDVRVRSKAENRYSPIDSPSSVSSTYIGALIGGDQTAANGDTGCTNGQRNRFELHLDDRVPSTSRAIKSKGTDIIEIKAPLESPVNPLTSILMSQTAGLANFNGGKMLLHKKNRLSLVTAGDLANNVSTDFFFYHEATRSDLNIPMFSVVQRDNQNGLQAYVIPEGTAEAGRQRLRIRNESGATLTAGAALNFHVYTLN